MLGKIFQAGKGLTTAVLSGVFVLVTLNSAHALIVTYTDVYDPADDIFIFGGNKTITYTQDLTDDGYDFSYDTMISAGLTLIFQDDENNPPTESVKFYFDGTSFGDYVITGGTDSSYTALFNSSLDTLLADGYLDVTLERDSGDFYFVSSTLTVITERYEDYGLVSEPSSISLMGIGLAGLGFVLRRRKKLTRSLIKPD